MKPQRLSINALAKLGSLIVDGLVALIVVSYFVNRLGSEAYGIVPWLTSLFVFFTIIPSAVQTAAGRFFTYATGRRDHREAQHYFSTSYRLFAVLGAAGFVITILLAWLGSGLFPFTPQYIPTARLLTLMLGFAVSLDIARSAFSLAFFARQRFDLENGVMITGALVRLGVIIGMSEIFGISLLWIGVGTLAGSVLRASGGWYYFGRIFPEIKRSFAAYNRLLLRPLSVFALEVLIAGVGLIILNQADILVAGWLLGSAAVTVYFCGAKWGLLFRAVIGAFTSVLVPRITTLQAEGKHEDIRRLAVRADRLVMPLGWLIAAILFAFARPLIITWVGPERAAAVGVLQVIVFPMALTVSAYVAISVLTGLGKIRESSLSAFVIAIINPALSVYAVVQLEMGVVGIALASALCLVARNGIYLPLLARRHAGIPLSSHFRELALGAIAALPSFGMALLAVRYVDVTGWIRLVPAVGACSVPTLIVWWVILARPEDRRLLKNLLPFYEPDRSGQARP